MIDEFLSAGGAACDSVVGGVSVELTDGEVSVGEVEDLGII